MEFQKIYLLIVFSTCLCNHLVWSYRCDRTPDRITRPKNTKDTDRYMIDIVGNPSRYTPLENYTLSLQYNPMLEGQHMFRDFMLTLDHEAVDDALESTYTPNTGTLTLHNDMLATFSRRCQNTILQTSSVPKSEVQVTWNAPPSGSGCVAVRATVLESKEEWFSDDGLLTKILCEEITESDDVQPTVLKTCCACDEAKYELSFEGTWSRNTHPKDFPSDLWSTRFSEVIGSSHAYDESFWTYGGIASDSMKDLAEEGITSGIESELKEKMGKTVRTIIKANGLSYPNVTGQTFTVFRADNKNHLVSVVSKITPSPDWVLGVSNFELCQKDCSWSESKVLNLYPWDIGTDNGASYISPNDATQQRNPIRKIKSNSPNDPRSPFYDENGEEMKPLAKLHLTRLKLYEKECDESETTESDGGETTEKHDVKCKPTDWSDWSHCSNPCGKGFTFRQRDLVIPENKKICFETLAEQKECVGESENCGESSKLGDDDPKCELTEFGEWSSCSTDCGKGTRTRDKKLKDPDGGASCQNNNPSILQQNEDCDGEKHGCDEEDKENNNNCPKSIWGPWSSCNVTCGTGAKMRYLMPEEGSDEEVEDSCNRKNKEEVECYEPLCIDEETTENSIGGITALNQVTTDHVISSPLGAVTNCKVTGWSVWGPCELTESCGKGYRTKHRQITQHAMNGGRACPRKLMKKRRCNISCKIESTTRDDMLPTWGGPAETTENIQLDCIMSPWSAWSPCSGICGGSAVQQKTRSILRYPTKGGRPCRNRIQQRPCPLPFACAENGLSTL